MGPSGDIEAGCSTGNGRIVDLGQSESQQRLLDHSQSQETQRGFGSQIPSVLGAGPPREHATDRDGQVELSDLVNKPNQQSIKEQTEVSNAPVGAHGQSSGTTSNVDSGARGGAANDQSHSQPDGLHQDKDRDVYEQNALRKCSEGWSGLSSNLKKYDEEKIKRVNDDMDTLLVFAGLFSAVVTAFCIEFYKSLQPDPNQTPAALLLQISRQLASFNANGLTLNSSTPAAEQSILTSMPPSRTSVNINIFWFLSLVFSLTTASLVILVKQWLREYLVYDTNLSPQPHIRVRHFRNEGMEKFRVFEIAAVLPMLLQIALGLFFIGLAIFLIDLDLTVGWSITPFIILWASLFVITLFTPAVFAHCPYHTPLLKGLLHATRHSLYKSMAYIYLLIHQKYARRPNRVTWDRLKLSATLATARYRLIISEGGWLHLVSRTCLHWGKWLLYSAPRCVFDSMVISIKWRFEEGYQADHPFLDEKRARNDASMDVTCLTTISVKFMDDEYLKLCFDATRNMRYKDMHGFYLSTRPPSFDEDYYYDVSLDGLLRPKRKALKYTDSEYPAILDDLRHLCCLSMKEGYNRKTDVIALFNTLLREGPYSALLVVSACDGPFQTYSRWKEFFTQIEVSSDLAMRNFFEAVSKITSYTVVTHKFKLGTTSKPDPPTNPFHGHHSSLRYYISDRLTNLSFFTFAVLAGVDESLTQRHSDNLLDMQNCLVEAVDQVPSPLHVYPSDGELLQEILNSWKIKAPSPAHQQATEKLLASLLDKMRRNREAEYL